jgi:hypothetical protein
MGTVEFEEGRGPVLKDGRRSVSPGALPKFVTPILGSALLRGGCGRLWTAHTSKQNSDQSAGYFSPVIFSSLPFLHFT